MSEFDRGTRFGELYDHITATQPPTAVPRLARISQVEFETVYAANSKPFVLDLGPMARGAAPIEAIRNSFAGLTVKVRHGDYVNPQNYAPERRKLVEMSLSEYLLTNEKLPPTANPPYAGNFALPRDFLETLGAGAPAFYPAGIYEPPTVWLGGAGCITPLHRDSSDNFAIHLVGKKRWTIFAPHEAPYLYMSSVAQSKGGDFATSAVDLRNPDLTKFPLFAKARCLTIDLSAGEMLYLPMGWSHYVENLTTCLMVNHWLSVQPLGIAALSNR